MKGTCSANFWSCTEHPMDLGLNGHCLKGLCPRGHPAKYILRLWAAITIQYTQNWKTLVGLPCGGLPSYKPDESRILRSQGRRVQPAKIYFFSQHFHYAHLEI